MGIKGQKKTGGRKKGSLNKTTELLFDLVEERDLEPIEGLSRSLAELEGVIAYDSEEQISIIKAKIGIYVEIMKYLYPKRKAIEYNFKDKDALNRIIKIQWADQDADFNSENEEKNASTDSDQPIKDPV
jgi:hypothetical protein